MSGNRSLLFDKALSDFLGGGFPKGAAVLLAGSSGTGKTVFSLQWLFEGAKHFGERGLYITLTEPISKALQNLQGLSFFDPALVEAGDVRFYDLRAEIMKRGLEKKVCGNKGSLVLMDLIEELVTDTGANRLVIDSITAICLMLNDRQAVRDLVFGMGTSFNALNCTTLMTSEIEPDEEGYSVFGVEEFIADALIKLAHSPRKDSTMRTMQLLKMRGGTVFSPLRHFEITGDGITLMRRVDLTLEQVPTNRRVSTGVRGLDKMCHGGLWQGSTTLVNGSSGTGKSILSMHFLRAGLKRGEHCLWVAYEESMPQIYRNASSFGWDLKPYVDKGLLDIMMCYPEDKPLEAHLQGISRRVAEMKAERVVIDSISRIAGAAASKEEYTDFLKRLNASFKRLDVTALYTNTSAGLLGAGEPLAQSYVSTITDSIILFKYVEIAGTIRRIVSVLKLRGSDHSKSLHEFTITGGGMRIGKTFRDMEGLTTGVSRRAPLSPKVRAEVRRFRKLLSSEFMEPVMGELARLHAQYAKGELTQVEYEAKCEKAVDRIVELNKSVVRGDMK